MCITELYIENTYRKLSVSLPSRGYAIINYRKFKNFDPIKFRHVIRLQVWSYINNFNNPNYMWHFWKTTFNSIVEKKHAPPPNSYKTGQDF